MEKTLQPVDVLEKNPFYRQEIYTHCKPGATLTPKEVRDCWHCPKALKKYCYRKPIRYNPLTKIYEVEGFYNSLNCVKKSMMQDPSQCRRLELLTQMAEDVYGVTGVIHPAPEREQFTNLGGHIDCEQWFKKQALTPSLTPTYLRSAPFVDSTMVIEYKFQDMANTRRALIENAMQDDPPKAKTKKAKTTKKPATLDSLLQSLG